MHSFFPSLIKIDSPNHTNRIFIANLEFLIQIVYTSIFKLLQKLLVDIFWCHFRNPSHDVGFDFGVIGTPKDLEKPSTTPILAPRIGGQPIRSSKLIGSPAENFDGVVFQSRSKFVLVNTYFITKWPTTN